MTDQSPTEDPQDIQFVEPAAVDIPTSPEVRKVMREQKALAFCEDFAPKAKTLLGEIKESHSAAAKEALAAVIGPKNPNDPLVFARGAAEIAYAAVQKYEEQKRNIERSQELTEDGKAEHITKARQELGEKFDETESKFIEEPLKRLVARHCGVTLNIEPKTEAEAAKISAKLAAYRQWSPRRVVEDFLGLLNRNDIPTVYAMRPLLERELDSPRPWWESYSGVLETLVAAADKKLDTRPDLMRDRTAKGAAAMVRSEWKYIRGFALGDVNRRGAGSVAFEMAWSAGALSTFNAPERFRPNGSDVPPTNSSTDGWMS